MKNVCLIFVFSVFLIFVILTNLLLLNYPVIKVNEHQEVGLGEEYKPEKAEVIFFHQKIKSDIFIKQNINLNKMGEYKVTYSTKVLFLKIKKDVIVEVKDKIKPEITLKGEKEVFICPGKTYEEDGYIATDNIDGDITEKVVKTKLEDGILYTVEDSSLNKAKEKRIIKEEDKEGPNIKLYGGTTVYLSVNESYKDPGYEAIDNCDGNVSKKVSVTSNLDTSKVGSYKKTYVVEDSYGNKTQKERTIIVRNKKTASLCGSEPGVIYLTFDDGPNPIYTPKILDILKKYNVKATFFVTMAGPDNLIKREYNEGHTVALHTASHDYKTVYSSVDGYFNDLYKVQNRVYNIIGMKPTIIRFPGGSSNTVSSKYNKGIMSVLASEVESRGFKYYDWNISSGDAGGTTNPNTEYHNVVSNLSKKCTNMILFHDIKAHTANAIENIVKYGVENGYTFKAITKDTAPIHHTINN